MLMLAVNFSLPNTPIDAKRTFTYCASHSLRGKPIILVETHTFLYSQMHFYSGNELRMSVGAKMCSIIITHNKTRVNNTFVRMFVVYLVSYIQLTVVQTDEAQRKCEWRGCREISFVLKQLCILGEKLLSLYFVL